MRTSWAISKRLFDLVAALAGLKDPASLRVSGIPYTFPKCSTSATSSEAAASRSATGTGLSATAMPLARQ